MATLDLTDERYFIDGVPVRVTAEEWRRHHLASFPLFSNPDNATILNEAIDSVYTMFLGVASLWKFHGPDEYFAKVQLVYRLLICWYIADLYPRYSPGIISNAGMPIVRKKIGPIDLTFNAASSVGSPSDLLAPLLSNPFGAKVHLILRNAAVRFKILNGHRG